MREPLRTLTSTRGGSRETDMKAVAVIPDVLAAWSFRAQWRLVRCHQHDT